MIRPAYKSDIYYGVVIGGERYEGWKCIYAGDGLLSFQRGSDEKRFEGGSGMGWLERAWDQFTQMVSSETEKANG